MSSKKTYGPIDEAEGVIPFVKFDKVITKSEQSTLYRVYALPSTEKRVYSVCKKVLVEKLPDSKQTRTTREVEQNLKATQRLIHPHIIKCSHVFVVGKAVYSLLDYYPLGSVQDRLRKLKSPLPLKQSRVYFAQVLGAVSYIHSRGMAHRNIKLTSLLLASEEAVILSGFTHCCLAYKREVDIMRCTLYLSNIPYRSPEMQPICSEVWPYDAKAADMYALGVCLFQMVNLELPFDANLYTSDQVAYINKQRNRDYKFNPNYVAYYNDKMKHLIYMLLEPTPGSRIGSSTALLHEALLPE